MLNNEDNPANLGNNAVVASIENLHRVALRTPTPDNIRAVDKALYDAVWHVVDYGDSAATNRLVKVWLEHTGLALDNFQKNNYSPVKLDQFGFQLLASDTLTMTIEDDACHLVLAYLCGHLVCEGYPAKVLHYLQAWSGQDLPKNVGFSPHATIDFIFGDGTWDLYRPDVTGDAELPQLLFKEKVPVSKRLRNRGIPSTTIEQDVPRDMI